MQDVQEQYWSKFAQTYDANQAHAVGEHLLKAMTTTVNELSLVGDVVEFGCGTGYFTQTLVKKANHVTATDLSDELLDVANARFKDNPNITTQKENCMQTSFPAQRFDTVFMANVIHIIEDPLKALQESHRILKDDGRVIIVSFTNSGMTRLETLKLAFRFLKAWGKPPRYARSFSLDKLSAFMESAGFRVEKSQLIGKNTKAVYIIGKKK